MKKVCVITGGGSGMGLATAKIIGKENYIIIVGRSIKKLEGALAELRAEGIEAESFACDISDRAAVDILATYAKEKGKISSVIHAAGMSPHMGEAKKIMEANALGTININEAFYNVIEEGSCIIDVSSMSAHLTPKIIMPERSYKYSRIDKVLFMRKMMARVNLFPKKLRSSVAYGISKHFVIWYAKTDAAKFGKKGIRLISISPGNFETPMGDLEKESASEYTEYCAIKRFGYVDEIANLFSFCASDKCGYLTGVDILCDGGCVASGCNPLKMR
ncbi:SDR family oxidoreductase [Clostridium folliculivorans]|uniref:Oxidoreductase n=1 Tax=Clostridium folliculivorans TaxID=2886038 RepID=A0A9W5Y4Z2_9CLOT|nr:SDR family oxidoreductase [Clostridium folliculivorans]GKU26662.1 oxidoreductase [Clostridium folliculivorans]GKU28906.1 oxidoreductase [Clostridium folliculivorans]